MRIVFFDSTPSALLPFSLLKPSWEVPLGGITLRAWATQSFPSSSIEFQYGGFQDIKITHTPLLAFSGIILPTPAFFSSLTRRISEGHNFEIRHGGEVVVAYYQSNDKADTAVISVDQLGDALSMLKGPWDIIRSLPTTLALALAMRPQGLREIRPGVYAGADVELPPSVITKTAQGAIMIGEGTSFGEYAVLRGPLVFGTRCKIRDHAVIESSAFGDVCKVGGEIESCVFDSYSNKQHHGYFGHTMVGSWVNIGAGACTSDLKHTYGSVRVDRGFGKEETDLQFCGSFIGESSRVAINASLMTGTVLGVNVFAFGTVRGYIPSFSSTAPGGLTEVPFDVAWRSRDRAMQRRALTPSPQDHDRYAALFEKTDVEREKRNVHHGVPKV